MQPETKLEQSTAPEQEKKEEIKPDAVSASQVDADPNLSEAQKINWKNFREERARERKEKAESDKRAKEKEAEANALKAAMDAILNKQSNQSQQHQEQHNNYEDESEEERIDKKVNAALARKEQEYEQKRKEREAIELPNHLQKTFGDFNQTCTTENLDYLEFHYPEVAQAYRYMPEGFDKWASIYKAVKRFVPSPDSRKDSAKADRNRGRPQSASSPGVTQSGVPTAPHILDEQRKAANWERMTRIMKGGN